MSTDVHPSETTLPEPPVPGQKREVSEQEARQVAEAARETTWQRPSFAKELYLGRFDLGLIHPHPQGSADDVARGEAFLTELRAVLEKIDGRQIERDDVVRPEDYKALAAIGCFGMKIPLKYGGLGLTMAYYGKALMLAGSIHPSLGALLSAHQSIGVPEPVKSFGTDDQKERFLPRCAAGAVTAFLLTEPDVGSDPARMSSTAAPQPDGSYLLDGVKLWTTNGVVAELVVVMAYVPKNDGGRGGISAFVVETSSEGITVERRNQ
ncbi:MAG TPA: acyl-CoA dehydrogenase family protein, partial [Nocardioidaceae bacterium]|nr:acyl-CoA dehydrogenase family protein [Nocardioidaceae bacterium]